MTVEPSPILPVDQLASMWAGTPTTESPVEWRHYRPLSGAVDDFVKSARSSGDRFYLGVDELDRVMRGIGRGELALFVGFAHQGKTVLLTHAIHASPDARVALFTPDETRPMVLCKLTSMLHGVSAEDLEARIAAGDDRARQLLADTAERNFPNLAVFDNVSDIQSMRRALGECQDVWGGNADLVAFDYAQLLRGGPMDDGLGSVLGKFDALKEFGSVENVPMVVLHQSSRSKGTDGAAPTIDSGAFGGEQHATFSIGVRRKRSMYAAQIRELEEKLATAVRSTEGIQHALDEARYDFSKHANSISFTLTKNKRPPGKTVEELDFHLDPDTGALIEWTGGPVTSRRPEPVEWDDTPTWSARQVGLPDAARIPAPLVGPATDVGLDF